MEKEKKGRQEEVTKSTRFVLEKNKHAAREWLSLSF